MNFKICHSFQYGPKVIAFVQTMSHSGLQCLIFMAQNVRSAQSYMKWPTYTKKISYFWGHERSCLTKTNVFRSSYNHEYIMKVITTFKIIHQTFKLIQILIYFMTLYHGWSCMYVNVIKHYNTSCLFPIYWGKYSESHQIQCIRVKRVFSTIVNWHNYVVPLNCFNWRWCKTLF